MHFFIHLLFVCAFIAASDASLQLKLEGEPDTDLFIEDIAKPLNASDLLLDDASNVRYFAVLQPKSSISLSASFGPIQVREVLFPASIQDALLNSNVDVGHEHSSLYSLASAEQLSGHLVQSSVYRNSPTLDVLLHLNRPTIHSKLSNNHSEPPPTAHALASTGAGEPRPPNSPPLSSTPATPPETTNANHRHEPSSDEPSERLCGVVAACYQAPIASSVTPISTQCLVHTCSLAHQDACLARLTVPADWWPPVNLDAPASVATSNGKGKPPRNGAASVAYAALHTAHCGQASLHSALLERLLESKLSANVKQPSNSPLLLQPLGQVQLKPFTGAYEELTADDIIRVLVPQRPLRPSSRIHVPVCYRYHRDYPLFAFALRVRVRAGLRVLGARLARKPDQTQTLPVKLGNNARKNRLLAEYNRLNAPQDWRIAVDVNSRQTQATITARVQNESAKSASSSSDDIDDEDEEALEEFDDDLMALMPATCREVYTLLLEVSGEVEQADAGRIVFQLLYLSDTAEVSENETPANEVNSADEAQERHGAGLPSEPAPTKPSRRDFERDSSKLTTKLDIQKDDVRCVLGVSATRHLMNTAMLTGRQLVQPLRVYVVSEAGKYGEVTAQSTCASDDESVLKVSPSCASLYLDGSESRAASNASITIRYGTYTGTATFQVWAPRLPLEIRLSDNTLNAIAHWKTLHIRRKSSNSANSATSHVKMAKPHFSSHGSHPTSAEKAATATPDMLCRPRYQQAYVEVFARFHTSDPLSGREFSMLGRRNAFKVTHLVRSHLRLADPRLAVLRGRTVEGLTPGRTQLQVISPLNGRLLAATPVIISDEQVKLDALEVRLITGLSLQVRPQMDKPTEAHPTPFAHWPQPTLWQVHARLSSALRAQYQEGLLDIRLRFSDKSVLALTDVADTDYTLRVNTFESGALAYAPSLAAAGQPRLLALQSAVAVPLLLQLHPAQQCDRPHRLVTSGSSSNSVNVAAVSLDAPLAEHTMLVDVNIGDRTASIAARRVEEPDTIIQNDASRGQVAESGTFVARSAAQMARAVHQLRDPQVLARQHTSGDQSDNSMSGPLVAVVAAMIVLFAIIVLASTAAPHSWNLKMFGGLKGGSGSPRGQQTTVTTVKIDEQEQEGKFASRLHRLVQDMGKLATKQTEEKGVITLRENPCHELDSNRSSCISHPESEMSIQITTNPAMSHEEECPTPRPSTSPLPNSAELRAFLARAAATQPIANTYKAGYHRQPPPPIPPRRQPALMNGTYTKRRPMFSPTGALQSSALPGTRQLPIIVPTQPGSAARRAAPPPIPAHRAMMRPLTQPKIISNPLSISDQSAHLISNPFIVDEYNEAIETCPPPVPPHAYSLDINCSTLSNRSSSIRSLNTLNHSPMLSPNCAKGILYSHSHSLESAMPPQSEPSLSHSNSSSCSSGFADDANEMREEQEQFRKMDYKQLVDYIESLKESCA